MTLSMPARLSRAAVLATVTLLALACDPPAPTTTPAKIEDFSATPNPVAAGADVTVHWKVSGDFTELEIVSGGASFAHPSEAEGTVTIEKVPAGKLELALNVTAADGKNQHADISVDAVTKPTIGAFTADKLAVAAGAGVTLTWQTALADKVVISADGTDLGEKTGADAAAGGLLVKPEATTTYTLTATGIGGSDTKSVKVTVLPAPVFGKLELSPERVLAGNPTTLSWETTQATSLTVMAGGRNIFAAPADQVAAGSRSFAFDATTKLTVTIAGPGGEVSKDIDASVIPPVRISHFAADPPDVITGSDVTLSWDVTGAETVQLTANGGVVDLGDLATPSNAITLTPTQTTVYELLATGEGGTASATVTVSAYSIPLIDSFMSDKAVVFRHREPAVLSWVTHSGTEFSIADEQGNLVDTGNQPVDAGSIEVAPFDSTSYTFTLVGPGGAVQSAPVAVEVRDPVPAVTFAASKPQVLKGEGVGLSWTVSDHTTMTIMVESAGQTPYAMDLSAYQTVPPAGTTVATDSLTTGSLDDTTTFTLTATGPGGTESKAITVTVVKLPEFTKFTSDRIVHDDASGTDQIVVTKGKSYKLIWETTDADGVTFDPPTGGAFDADPFVSILGMPGTTVLTRTSSADYGTSDVTFPDDFNFPFFGNSYHTVQMDMDGYICFGGSTQCNAADDSEFSNTTIPSTGIPNNLIAVFWDDLEATTDTKFLMRMDGTKPNRRVTLEWNNIDFYSSSDTGTPWSMQAVIFEDGNWEIRHSPRATPTTNLSSNRRWGDSATIGIEGPGGGTGILVAKDQAGVLCSSYTAGTSSAAGKCTPYTRVRQLLLGPAGSVNRLATKDELVSMIASGPVGKTKSPSLPVHVVDPATITTFTASKSYIGSGESVVFTYAAGPNATTVTSKRINDGTSDLPGVNTLSGTVTVSPTVTTTYTFEVGNAAGDKDTKSITVTVAKPEATLKADRTRVPSGEQVKFSWTSNGATSLTLKAPDGSVISGPYYSTTDASTVASGSFTAAVTQTGAYVVEASNGSGTTTATVALDVPSELQIVSFTSTMTEQTAGENTVLNWETFNAASVSIQIEGEDQPLSGMPITDAVQVRNGTFPAPVRATDTTYVLTTVAKTGGGTATQRVTVHSVAPATIDTLTLSAAAVSWNDTVNVSWTTTNATSVHLYQVTGTGANPPNGPEVTDAVDRTTGSVTVRLLRSTAFRLVVANRLGTQVAQLSSMVVVSVSTPTMSLSVTPANGVPFGGALQVGWTSTQAERVYLFGADAQYAPNQFVDISATGTELAMKTSSGTADFNSGFANLPLPTGFSPQFFGDAITAMTVNANGVIGLAATGSPYCGPTSNCSSISTLPSSTYKGVIAVFSRDLSACFAASTDSACTSRGRAPGKVYWELKGTAPNRFLVVQWNDWDFYSSTSKGSLTFEAKIYESGIVELQYKTMQSASSTAFTGSGGVGMQNTAYTQAFNLTTRPLNSGDGWRFDTNTTTPQVPYDYVPFDFVDISRTGTEQAMKNGSAADFDDGSATVNFPADFSPIFFGEPMTGAVVGADGVLSLSGSGNYSCTTGCTSVGTLPNTTYKAVVAAFNADLTGCFGSTDASECTTRGRPAGKVFTELRGTAPNRVFIAQWNDWDFYSSSNAGSLTFQVKVYENGDAEVQYKTLESKSGLAASGSGTNIGVQNSAGSIGVTVSSGTTTNFHPVSPGDGFRYYSGNQALSGSIRTFFNLPSTATRVTYRGTAINSISPGGVTDSKSVPLLPGANDILISELMIDPVAGADDNKEWIELRNRKTVAVPLAGYTIQTSSGAFTFLGGQIPAATSTTDGFLVIGQSQDPALNGNVPVQLAYGNAVQMNDSADTVILRFGNTLIDRVEYDVAAGWRVPRGQSLSAEPGVSTGIGNDVPSSWCGGRSTTPGDKFSPGATNLPCSYMEVIPYDATYHIAADPTATKLSWGTSTGNDRTTTFTLPFPLTYFGNTYTDSTVTANDNGWLSLGAASTSSSWSNTTLPASSPGGVDGLYPYWDDLYPKTGRGNIYTKVIGTAPTRALVVEWDGYYPSGSSAADVTMSVVLFENGAVPEFHYTSLGGATGSSATIGLEGGNDAFGVTYSYNQASLPPSGTSGSFALRYARQP